MASGLKFNHFRMFILKLLSLHDSYGYEMVQTINTVTNGYISLKEASLYTTLYKLEEEGLVSSYKKKVGLRMERNYFHIEQKGIEELENLIYEYQKYQQCIDDILHIEKILSKQIPHEEYKRLSLLQCIKKFISTYQLSGRTISTRFQKIYLGIYFNASKMHL